MQESPVNLRIAIDVNVKFPGLLALLQPLKENIMTALEDLQASAEALLKKVEESNAKTDALILIANTTKDALVALQGQATGITAADIQAIVDKQKAAVASLTAQEAETDAAAVAVAP